MAPYDYDPASLLKVLPLAANGTVASSAQGALKQHAWSGGLNAASVDLIAMVVSDAGLASTEPKWWNASPLGCMLLGSQPRGGWQVLQRSVQWGTDHWAHAFGVDCKVSVLYEYFACSIRNRLEVWESQNFVCPMPKHDESPPGGQSVQMKHGIPQSVEAEDESNGSLADPNLAEKGPVVSIPDKEVQNAVPSLQIRPVPSVTNTQTSNGTTPRRASSQKIEKSADTGWQTIDRGIRGIFAVARPTKLMDGSRGGQAFVCDVLKPVPGTAYGVEEQSRVQLLSVILAVAGLAHADDPGTFARTMSEDFELNDRLGSVFHRLLPCLIVANVLIIGLTVSVFYALWRNNIFGRHAPYAIQMCSLASWSSGAIGLMMLGGNPRVTLSSSKPAPKHVQDRLELVTGDYVPVSFGSLHGSVYVEDRGTCYIPVDVLRSVCRWRIRLTRNWKWQCGMAWFCSFLLISIVLQIVGARIATIKSEVLSIVLLILTSLLRGAGLSGPEKWMIPRWKRREGATYAVKLQGQIQSRVTASET